MSLAPTISSSQIAGQEGLALRTESGIALRRKLTRRDLMTGAGKAAMAASLTSYIRVEGLQPCTVMRSINIMNFLRSEEPRESIDLFEPLKEQMALIRKFDFPATWLLQYDALAEGPFVEFLKKEMPANHEVGIWFEMNRRICDDAGVAWRGRPDWEWDYHVPVAYAIGYTPEERRRLADTAMATFRRVFGKDAKTIASWNLDAVSLLHFVEHYGVDAFGNCRDQLATDGFTIWGAPIAGYYPSRKNAWSPALDEANQISTPMFRLLGQDPVYYYDNQFRYPDTMEPVWASGQSQTFVDRFLDMIANGATQSFAYAQLGQENSFGWPSMQKAYPMQMEKLAKVWKEGHVTVETMGETGRRFKRTFSSTPPQAQVMLSEPFGSGDTTERTVWYQSKYFRANLHFRDAQFYLRDLHVYDDRFAQPYLEDTVRQHGIEQRMLAVLDGFHWSDDQVRSGQSGVRAMGIFSLAALDGKEHPLAIMSTPAVKEISGQLRVTVPLTSGGSIEVAFTEKEIIFRLKGQQSPARLGVNFEWVPDRSAFQDVSGDRLHYRFRDFDYSVRIGDGIASKTLKGVRIISKNGAGFRLHMSQKV